MVVELKPEGVLPVDAAADGVGGLSIREILGELHHGDQGELPGGQSGLSAPGVEFGEVGVAEDRFELVPEPDELKPVPRMIDAGDVAVFRLPLLRLSRPSRTINPLLVLVDPEEVGRIPVADILP